MANAKEYKKEITQVEQSLSIIRDLGFNPAQYEKLINKLKSINFTAWLKLYDIEQSILEFSLTSMEDWLENIKKSPFPKEKEPLENKLLNFLTLVNNFPGISSDNNYRVYKIVYDYIKLEIVNFNFSNFLEIIKTNPIHVSNLNQTITIELSNLDFDNPLSDPALKRAEELKQRSASYLDLQLIKEIAKLPLSKEQIKAQTKSLITKINLNAVKESFLCEYLEAHREHLQDIKKARLNIWQNIGLIATSISILTGIIAGCNHLNKKIATEDANTDTSTVLYYYEPYQKSFIGYSRDVTYYNLGKSKEDMTLEQALELNEDILNALAHKITEHKTSLDPEELYTEAYYELKNIIPEDNNNLLVLLTILTVLFSILLEFGVDYFAFYKKIANENFKFIGIIFSSINTIESYINLKRMSIRDESLKLEIKNLESELETLLHHNAEILKTAENTFDYISRIPEVEQEAIKLNDAIILARTKNTGNIF